MIVSYIAYLVIGLTLIYFLVTKKMNLFQVYLFVLPFHSWYINIGLNLFASQVIAILMLAKVVLFLPRKNKNLFYIGNYPIVFYTGYSILITVVMTLIYHDNFLKVGGFFRSEGRFITQIILFLISLSIIPLSYNYLTNLKSVKSNIKVFLNAIIFLTILGWIQLVIYYGFHHDIFPIAISESGVIRSGVWNTPGFNFFRMSSLGGEPKSLSITLVLGFFILRVFNKNKLSFYGKYDKAIKPIFVITAIATASTSGLILLAILHLSDILFDIFHSKLKLSLKVKIRQIIVPLAIVSIVGSFAYIYWDYIMIFLQARIFDRDIASEDFDYPIQEFLIHHKEFLPFGTGLGNAHNFSYPYILPETKQYMSNSIFVAKSGYLKLISETGIFGFVLFSLVPISIYSNLRHYLKKGALSNINASITKSLLSLLFLFFIGFLARAYLINEFLLIVAITCYISTHFYNLNGKKKMDTK